VEVVVAAVKDAALMFDVTVPVGVYTVVVAKAFRNLVVESTCSIVVSTDDISVVGGDFIRYRAQRT
jgi:type 1 fimbria pilin